MELTSQFNKKLVTAFLFAVIAAMIAVACGSDSGGGGDAVARVVASDRIYTSDDLIAAGAKRVTEYDVDELPGADSAFKYVYNALDYEARFYPSHQAAVADGTEYANSVTGDDAIVTGDEVLWEEGRKDRRKCSRAAQTPHSSCTYSARYLEYVIRGNMILFCEGDESSDAFENCEKLLALTETAQPG